MDAATGAVAIPNVALPAPWGILKPSGTATAALLAKNCTSTPPAPAGSLSVADGAGAGATGGRRSLPQADASSSAADVPPVLSSVSV